MWVDTHVKPVCPVDHPPNFRKSVKLLLFYRQKRSSRHLLAQSTSQTNLKTAWHCKLPAIACWTKENQTASFKTKGIGLSHRLIKIMIKVKFSYQCKIVWTLQKVNFLTESIFFQMVESFKVWFNQWDIGMIRQVCGFGYPCNKAVPSCPP